MYNSPNEKYPEIKCCKCVRDASYSRIIEGGSLDENYAFLHKSRHIDNNKPCTPEQYAGSSKAMFCPFCKQMTIHHQFGTCMNPNCEKFMIIVVCRKSIIFMGKYMPDSFGRFPIDSDYYMVKYSTPAIVIQDYIMNEVKKSDQIKKVEFI